MVTQYSEELIEAMEQAQTKVLDHAAAIGELCMSWAAMDNSINDLLEPLVSQDHGISACISTGIDRIEPRILIVKRLLVHQKITDNWRKWLEEVLHRVTGELGPLRNRYIHDQWHMRKGKMQRLDKRAFIAKPQSRQPDKLIFERAHVTPVEELRRLRANVDTITWVLQIATYDLHQWRTTGQLRPLRKRLIPASKRRTRMDHFPIMIVWNGERLPVYNYVTDP